MFTKSRSLTLSPAGRSPKGPRKCFRCSTFRNWAIRLIVILIIIGLPIALVLAWSFEITPQGIKRTETADAMPEATRKKKHIWIYVVVIGAVLSIGLFFLGRFTALNTASPARTSNKSIAVLPFGNLCRDSEYPYF